jgi:hypothetical protein
VSRDAVLGQRELRRLGHAAILTAPTLSAASAAPAG